MRLFFDLETIPTQNQELKNVFAEGVTHPGNMKKAETIEKWEKEQKPAEVEKAIEKSVFDGGAGEIITFGMAIDDNDPQAIQRTDRISEKELLEGVNEIFKGFDYAPVWVGHNICGFDLRYLWKRFVVNNIRPVFKIPHDAKPWDARVFDTMYEWAGASNDKKSMDFVCKALGIKGKDGFDGSMVYQAWKDGEYNKIGEYCIDDVKRTRDIYNRLNFQ
jgi:predicted PolB exonuclease-like 3'-5' exonuclease